MTNSQASPSFIVEYLSNSADLRVAINGVIGISRLILEGHEPLSNNQREQINSIQHNGQILLYYFNNFLDASKIDTGKLDLHFQELDLIPLINTITKSPFILLPQNREVTIKKKMPQEVPLIWADELRMRQIIAEGIRHVATLCLFEDIVKLDVSHDDNIVKLLLSCGIPSGYIGRDFLSDEMTPLEFYICKQLIYLHGGNVSIRNDDVLELIISLPVKKETSNLP